MTNTAPQAALLHWAAWAPGLSTLAEWQAWAVGERSLLDTPDTPPVDFIPALQRRRLSRLSRLSLAAAYACGEGQHSLPTVFASQHGEIHRTLGLLTELAQREPLSPMAFSLSVHNTASGLYSIAAHNTAPSTAIAAGADTLPCALLEAVGQLQQHEEVMLVYAEEPLPEAYRAFTAHDAALLGLALRIGRPCADRRCWQLQALHDDPVIHTATPDNDSSGLRLIRWLCRAEGSTNLSGERFPWRVQWLPAQA